MAETKKISQPSQGTENLGLETNDRHSKGTTSAGSDTQLHITGNNGRKIKKDNSVNDDEKVIRNADEKKNFLTSNETDE